MLLEFVNRLVELAEAAKNTEIVPIGFRTYTRNGEPETYPPPPRADRVFDLLGFDDLLKKFADDCVVYCHAEPVEQEFWAVAQLDAKERADTVSLYSNATAQFEAMSQLEGGLNVKDLSELLRTTLYGAVPADVTHAVSRIDWTAKDSQTADAATMGRQVTKAVNSTTDTGLPEMVTLTLPVFDIPDLVIETDIHCAIVPDYDQRTIAIVSVDGLPAVLEKATQELCRRINERFNDSATITVVYGRSESAKFVPGSPAQ